MLVDLLYLNDKSCSVTDGNVDVDLDRGRKIIVKTELVTSMKEIIDGDWRLTVRDITK